MKRHVWIGVLIIACAAGSTACGDDDSGGDDPEGGSGGNRAGSGGSRAGSGGASGSGTSGSGGTGTMNPAGCPATMPAQDGECTMEGIECTYGMMECDCDPTDADPMMTAWDCSTQGGGMMQMCPATEPTNGGACTEGRGDCEFGARVCDCNDDIWACWDPADCPAMPPAEDSACPLVGMECEYDDAGGQGPGQGGGDCDCEDTGWDCGGDFGEDEDGGV